MVLRLAVEHGDAVKHAHRLATAPPRPPIPPTNRSPKPQMQHPAVVLAFERQVLTATLPVAAIIQAMGIAAMTDAGDVPYYLAAILCALYGAMGRPLVSSFHQARSQRSFGGAGGAPPRDALVQVRLRSRAAVAWGGSREAGHKAGRREGPSSAGMSSRVRRLTTAPPSSKPLVTVSHRRRADGDDGVHPAPPLVHRDPLAGAGPLAAPVGDAAADERAGRVHFDAAGGLVVAARVAHGGQGAAAAAAAAVGAGRVGG